MGVARAATGDVLSAGSADAHAGRANVVMPQARRKAMADGTTIVAAAGCWVMGDDWTGTECLETVGGEREMSDEIK